MTKPYILFSKVSFKRGNRTIFNKLDLEIRRGEVLAIMGPSGTGKTTLLRFITGELTGHRGRVVVNGEDISRFSYKKLYKFRRMMSMMFQSGALFTHLNVFDNVAFPLRAHTNLSHRTIHDLVIMKLEAVGLRGVASFWPSELSGGMARRVALARSLALDPKLMLYDEPFTGQDPASTLALVKLAKDVHQAFAMTSIFVSHDFEVSAALADRIVILNDGKVEVVDTPVNLRKSKNPVVKQFMGTADTNIVTSYPAMPYEKELDCA